MHMCSNQVTRGHSRIDYQSHQLHSLSKNFISTYDREKSMYWFLFSMTLRLKVIVFSEDNL